MTTGADYQTRPISAEVWGQMKELRRERYKLSLAAQIQGGLCVTGFAWKFLPLLAGFGNFGNLSPGTDFTRIAREGSGSEGLTKYVNLAESQGLSPVCGAIAAHMGQVYAGTSFGGSSGQKIMPQFVYQPGGCHAQYKGAQVCASILNLPLLIVDIPRKNNQTVGAGLGGYLSGVIFDVNQSYYWAFMVCGMLAIVAVIATLLLREETAKRRSATADTGK